jgi:high affinity Mn2+ porin
MMSSQPKLDAVSRGNTGRIAVVVLWLVSWVAAAEPASVDLPSHEQVALHGQFTYVEQEANAFRSPYRGANSLSPDNGRQTFDATLFLGARLWSGAEGWLDPEIDQGFGLDNTLGVAGFPSGEAYKVGRKRPYLRLPRAFIRQTFDLGEASEPVASAANQLGGSRSADRLVFTVGKFGVGDLFDASGYAHDPRSDFLNWTAIDAGTFDYAADAWGFTVGAAVEWYQGAWTLRGGAFDLSSVPNSEHLDPGGHQFQMILELERRFDLRGRAGRVAVTAYDSRARMGLLDAAVAAAAHDGGPVDIASVRSYRSRTGIHVLAEQQISDELGVFARAGGASGNVEAYEFTDIDRAIEAGLSLNGARWRRPRDTVGLAAMVNGISAARQRFLNAGGLGILVGDGRLPHPRSEQILEAYYSVAALSSASVTFDYQRINQPAYNSDRGPVSVFSIRLHGQF